MIPSIDLRNHVAGHAIDFASDQDRRWFADHPGGRRYQRAPVEYEFPELGGPVLYVVVTQIRPGVRVRMPVVRTVAT